jgi:hypothetical protein
MSGPVAVRRIQTGLLSVNFFALAPSAHIAGGRGRSACARLRPRDLGRDCAALQPGETWTGGAPRAIDGALQANGRDKGHRRSRLHHFVTEGARLARRTDPAANVALTLSSPNP